LIASPGTSSSWMLATVFNDHQTLKTVASIQLLDVPGDAIKGEIAH